MKNTKKYNVKLYWNLEKEKKTVGNSNRECGTVTNSAEQWGTMRNSDGQWVRNSSLQFGGTKIYDHSISKLQYY